MFLNPMAPQYSMDAVSNVQFQQIDGDFSARPKPYAQQYLWPAQKSLFSNLTFFRIQKFSMNNIQIYLVWSTFDVDTSTTAC